MNPLVEPDTPRATSTRTKATANSRIILLVSIQRANAGSISGEAAPSRICIANSGVSTSMEPMSDSTIPMAKRPKFAGDSERERRTKTTIPMAVQTTRTTSTAEAWAPILRRRGGSSGCEVMAEPWSRRRGAGLCRGPSGRS